MMTPRWKLATPYFFFFGEELSEDNEKMTRGVSRSHINDYYGLDLTV
jgi:hypothetical protein